LLLFGEYVADISKNLSFISFALLLLNLLNIFTLINSEKNKNKQLYRKIVLY
jgi:hypothetical protein